MRMLELFNDKDIDDLVDIAYNRCMNNDCDACPNRNEFEGEVCMNDIIRDLWRKWKNAVEERDASIDVVPVVRCKDCKYFDGEPGQPNIQCSQMHEDDFCSYGVRKGGDE